MFSFSSSSPSLTGNSSWRATTAGRRGCASATESTAARSAARCSSTSRGGSATDARATSGPSRSPTSSRPPPACRSSMPCATRWRRAAASNPESVGEVRQRAPAAFRAGQFRAVTAADYVDAALKAPGVSGAAAAFRWTGSWHTVFVAVNPRNQSNLVVEASGRRRLTPAFERQVRRVLALRAGRIRPRDSRRRVRPARSRRGRLCRQRLLPRRCRAGGASRVEQSRQSGSVGRLLPSGQFHVRDACLSQRALWRDRKRPWSGRRVRDAAAAVGGRTPGSSNRACCRSDRGRSRCSITIRTRWRTGCSA